MSVLLHFYNSEPKLDEEKWMMSSQVWGLENIFSSYKKVDMELFKFIRYSNSSFGVFLFFTDDFSRAGVTAGVSVCVWVCLTVRLKT